MTLETTKDCACGSPLDDENKYVSSEGDNICEDCWFIEDEENVNT